MSVCLVGEPTCPDEIGDAMKIGRRGSLTTWFTVTGVQGHSAYPHRAKNPVHAMARLMDILASHELDQGTDHFDPSSLAVVTMDTGNGATNVIPGQCTSTVNIRFNDTHTGAALVSWMEDEAAKVAAAFDLDIAMKVKISGESFITPPGPLSDLIGDAVQAETGRTPELSTSGGTSDARFVKNHCPVTEFGLVGKTMHQVDERVAVADIVTLKAIYKRILTGYFA
jgi:succinyl-diaminopimelate desuccinylase